MIAMDRCDSQSYAERGCTAAMVTGMTAVSNMVGQSDDWDRPITYWGPKILQLVIPKDGNRYFATWHPWMNEKGVCCVNTLHPAREFPPYPGPGEPTYITEADLMRKTNCAKEWVEMASENLTKYGPKDGQMGVMVIDVNEGYLVESIPFVYNDPANHAIHGPMTDQIMVMANFYVTYRLKQYERGVGCGYVRVRRAWELLIDKQFDGFTNRFRMGQRSGISLPYFMSVFRDHGNLSPEKGRMSTYISEGSGDYAICCHGNQMYTDGAYICVPAKQNTELVSCLWMTFSQPCLSPFLPVYIGVNSLPKEYSTSEAQDVFDELRIAVDYHSEYRNKITEYWTVFEIETIEQARILETEVAKLTSEGSETKARKMITDFIHNKCKEALAKAKDITKELNRLPIIK